MGLLFLLLLLLLALVWLLVLLLVVSELGRKAGIVLLLGWVTLSGETWTDGGIVCGAVLLCRRTNQAIWLMTHGAKNAAFRNVKTIAECLADELMNAAKGSSNSFAIKKKDELERVAKSNR